MANQSSAVLDLNDADVTDDTDAPSVSEDVEDVPLIMEHGDDIVVKVDCPMKQLSTLETYVTYRVRCVCARWATPAHVRRRYNHFKELHRRLVARHPWQCVPALPALHSAAQQLDRYAPRFVAARAVQLHVFLELIAQHPILTHSEDFRIFLTTPDEDFDKIFKSENSALNLWGLGSAFYSSGEAKSTNGARVKDPEFTAATDYLASLQSKLAALHKLAVQLYKGIHATDADYLNMSRTCSSWAGSTRTLPALGALATATHALAPAARARAPRRLPALPALAAAARSHQLLVQRRDALHGEYVAGNSPSDDLHNRLEQATEAIRSELAYWLPKTRSEVKNILLQIAERQVSHHSHALQAWEQALKDSTEHNPQELFKTVSKNALLNLSPSKYKNDITQNQESIDSDTVEVPVKPSSNSSGSVKDLTTDVQSNVDSVDASKVSDPLQSFSEVDLSR